MLAIEALSVDLGHRPILQGVSLQVRSGEVVSVIGPNGAGKSTLVKTISGVLPARAGRVLVDGLDLAGLPPRRRALSIAVVPQSCPLPGDYTVYETVMMGRTPHMGFLGSTSRQDRLMVDKALEWTSTADLAQRRVECLSGGEQQRVLLARALAQASPILLLDEPTAHLDLQHQSGLLNLVRRLAHEAGLAVLIVLHDLNLAGLYTDRVALLVEGRLQAVGTPVEVLTSPRLTSAYRVPVHVVTHPDYGLPLVLPDGRQ